MSGSSLVDKAQVDPAPTSSALSVRARGHLAGTDPAAPYASPALADLRGLPPLLIQAGSAEILLDDAVRLAAHPGLDVVVNAAGIMLPEDVLDGRSLKVAEDTIAANLLGTIRMVYAFAPHLATREQAAILTVSSGLAFVPLPLTPTYSATKAAVHSFGEALRVQLAGTSVQVIELVPPAVRTTLMNQENVEAAMPLDDFLTEAMSLLWTRPDAHEILVEKVQPLRYAVSDGTYDRVLSLLPAR
ncbi:short subunit dehydrogenase [Actinocorallia herbida]|uniref:Short subunit dehydrogenase n=2 Tax=Actinocorallia herbida TaxID=58109 RepID=A0A3N1D190_9ACTN|nr:short subunit dehydrogenase [Actinocorallia herbida]